MKRGVVEGLMLVLLPLVWLLWVLVVYLGVCEVLLAVGVPDARPVATLIAVLCGGVVGGFGLLRSVLAILGRWT